MSSATIRKINRLSRTFLPRTSKIEDAKKFENSKSFENLIKYGLIKPVNSGMYAFLPLGLRVLNKLKDLVDNEMERIGAQKIQLPALTSTRLWEKTDRYEKNKSELFSLQDRHLHDYILTPTYEEAICDLLSSITTSQKTLPLKLYQISSKWRDERKPRLGFLRSREFVMKDLYTFDANLDDAKKTYHSVCEAYDRIFEKIGLPFIKAIGDPGSIGGVMSHEYHYVSNIGEDILCTCSSCEYVINKVLCTDSYCNKCNKEFLQQKTSEVGHTFLLNTKYTESLKAVYTAEGGKTPLVMGCFGLGLSRIFSVMVEILSTKDELRWPKALTPYTVCIIPPKANSTQDSASQYVDPIIDILNQLNIDTILDDRTTLTIGNRFVHGRIIGYTYIIVIGKSAMESPPVFEIHDIYGSKKSDVTLENIHNYFNNESIKM